MCCAHSLACAPTLVPACWHAQVLEIGAVAALLLHAGALAIDWQHHSHKASIAACLAAALLVALLSFRSSLASWVTDAVLYPPRAVLLRCQVLFAHKESPVAQERVEGKGVKGNGQPTN